MHLQRYAEIVDPIHGLVSILWTGWLRVKSGLPTFR